MGPYTKPSAHSCLLGFCSTSRTAWASNVRLITNISKANSGLMPCAKNTPTDGSSKPSAAVATASGSKLFSINPRIFCMNHPLRSLPDAKATASLATVSCCCRFVARYWFPSRAMHGFCLHHQGLFIACTRHRSHQIKTPSTACHPIRPRQVPRPSKAGMAGLAAQLLWLHAPPNAPASNIYPMN